MNIELLSPEKLKVVLNTVDLNKYDLDYMSISSQSRQTKSMVRDILTEALNSSGFSTKNCKLLIEVVPGKNDGCILYLTKLPLASREGKEEKTNCRKAVFRTQQESYILSCGCLDDTIEAVNCFASFPDVPLANSALYDLSGNYFLVFRPILSGTDGKRLGSLLNSLSEYGRTDRLTPLTEAFLTEHGNAISNTRAVEKMLRSFL